MQPRHILITSDSVGPYYSNRLLNGLGPEELAAVSPYLHRVALRPRQVLVEPHIPIREAYFLENGTAGVISRTKQDRGLEVSMIGCMGMTGIPLVLGTDTSPFRCIVQIAGTALRISADDLRTALADIPALRRILLNYVQARMIQQGQIIVCNARHSVRQRVARWILMGLDRVESDELVVTHDLIARMLGVRRAGVSTELQDFESAGIVRMSRGRLFVDDREQLQSLCCGCYSFIAREYNRLIGEHAKRHVDGFRPASAQLPSQFTN